MKMAPSNKEKSQSVILRLSLLEGRISKLIGSSQQVAQEAGAPQTEKLQSYHEKIHQLKQEYDELVDKCVALIENIANVESDKKLEQIEGVLNTASEVGELVDQAECEIRSLIRVRPGNQGEFVDTNGSSRMSKVVFKDFDTYNPTLWFLELEMQFTALGITDERSKFVSLSRVLGKDFTLDIAPVTCDHDQRATPYSDAKNLLLKAYRLTSFQRLERAFAMKELSYEEKPTQYLARFKLLLEDATVDEICKWHLRRALPADVQLALSVEVGSETSLEMAERADQMIAVKQNDQSLTQQISVAKDRKQPFVCFVHQRYGGRAWHCMDRTRCSMKDQIIKRPQRKQMVQGNLVDEQ